MKTRIIVACIGVPVLLAVLLLTPLWCVGMLVGIIVFFSVLLVWGVWRKVDAYRKKQRLKKRRHHAKSRTK